MEALIDTADVETLIKCIELMPGAEYYQYRHCLHKLIYIAENRENCPQSVVSTVNNVIYKLNNINTAAQACGRLLAFCKQLSNDMGQRQAG